MQRRNDFTKIAVGGGLELMKTKTVKVPATTNNITIGIVNFLKARGHSASRVNTTGIWDERLQRFRTTGARKGFYDIAATIKTKFVGAHGKPIGMSVFIDTKRGRDKLSKEQLEFRNEIMEAGGCCFESKTYYDFEEWYNLFISQYI
jgi:hypothetical protein